MINNKDIQVRLKSFFSNGISFALMKTFARFTHVKSLISFFLNLRSLKILNSNEDDAVFLKETDSVDSIVNDLRKDGVSRYIYLQKDIVDAVTEYSKNEYCYASGDISKGFMLKDKAEVEKHNKFKVFVSKYFNIDYKYGAFKRLKHSKILDEIAKKYIGKTARHAATQLWWTFPVDVDEKTRSKFANFFHRDVDDWNFMKFFFYLDDVDEDSGPHEFIKGSHRPSLIQSFKEKFRINRHYDEQVQEWYDIKKVKVMTGKKGEGFAEDTFGLHKGRTPKKNSRLVLCLVYAIKDYGTQEWRYNENELGLLSKSD